MALSNIWREPRREITETLVGMAVIVPLIYLDYLFALWGVNPSDRSMPVWGQIVLLMIFINPILIGVAIAILCAVLAGAHWMGEEMTDWLDDRGIRLRPKQRY